MISIVFFEIPGFYFLFFFSIALFFSYEYFSMIFIINLFRR